MIYRFLENIRTIGPVFAFIWILTVACILMRPQKYFNSFLLMAALLVTMLFVAGFMGEAAGSFLLICLPV